MTERKRGGGFAAMDPEQRRAIARKGGAAVPADKRAYSNRDAAVAAGRKGGKAVPGAKRAFATNRTLASQAGTKGGEASAKRRREAVMKAYREKQMPSESTQGQSGQGTSRRS